MSISRRLQEIAEMPRLVADDIAQQVLKEAIRVSRVRTGKMKASWSVRVIPTGDNYDVQLTNQQEYSQYQKPDVFTQAFASVNIDLSKWSE